MKVVKMYIVTTCGLVICYQHFIATFRPSLQGTTQLPVINALLKPGALFFTFRFPPRFW